MSVEMICIIIAAFCAVSAYIVGKKCPFEKWWAILLLGFLTFGFFSAGITPSCESVYMYGSARGLCSISGPFRSVVDRILIRNIFKLL